MSRRFLYFPLAFLLTALGQSSFAQQSCEKLKDLQLPKVEITSATLVQSGSFAISAPTIAGRATVKLGAHCEVKAVARPTSDSEIGIEIWLPAQNWNGKYEQIGNGGWAGAIHEPPLAGAVRRGFVAAATDDGHKGGMTDDGRKDGTLAEFAIGHPEKLIDYGYRALGATRATALAAIKAFYGHDAVRSYFVGCSDGGREALMVAQRFPEDFDGILAGDPGNNWSHWGAGLVWNEQAQLADSPGAIPITKRALIQNAVIAACDTIDGVKDGLISDPRFCHFDPSVLTCKGTDAPDCLTAPQVTALKKIYDGPKNPRTGEQIYPGYPPGIENAPGSIIRPSPQGTLSFGDTYFGQALFEQKNWDFRTLDFDKDIAFSDRKGSPVVDSINPDLRSFRDHGGKLIQYHGWSDTLIPPGGSVVYYENVEAFLSKYPDPRGGSSNPVDNFYRLFMIPGMGHCNGGAGPTSIAPTDSVDATDPKHDLMLSLEQWVEKGIAPEMVIGSGKAPKDPTKTMSRPICPYPQVTRYKGTGDTNDAASFECTAPPVHQ